MSTEAATPEAGTTDSASEEPVKHLDQHSLGLGLCKIAPVRGIRRTTRDKKACKLAQALKKDITPADGKQSTESSKTTPVKGCAQDSADKLANGSSGTPVNEDEDWEDDFSGFEEIKDSIDDFQMVDSVSEPMEEFLIIENPAGNLWYKV